MNIRNQALLLLAVLADVAALVVFFIVWLLTSWWIGLIAAIVVWVVIVAFVYVRRETLAMAGMAPRPANPDDNPHLGSVLDGLVIAHGFDKPEVLMLNSSATNAAVVGRESRDSKLILTTGLVDALSRLEIEGVVAHLLTAAASADIGGATLASAVLSILPGNATRRRAVEWMFPEHFRIDTDLEAVGYTRYPPGFVASLEKLAAGDTTVPMARTANAHLWLADPIGDPAVLTERVHPPLNLRISVLREL